MPTQRSQPFGRALANIPRAPAATRILLQPARRQVVHLRVVIEPGQPLAQLLDAVGLRRLADWRLQSHRAIAGRGITAQRGARLVQQCAAQGQGQGARGVVAQAQVGLLAASAIQEQSLVAVHAVPG